MVLWNCVHSQCFDDKKPSCTRSGTIIFPEIVVGRNCYDLSVLWTDFDCIGVVSNDKRGWNIFDRCPSPQDNRCDATIFYCTASGSSLPSQFSIAYKFKSHPKILFIPRLSVLNVFFCLECPRCNMLYMPMFCCNILDGIISVFQVLHELDGDVSRC